MRGSEARLDEVRGLDRVVHEPARLAVLYCLSGGDVDFTFLSNETGVTPGTLSKHLKKLEEAGLVAVRKEFVLRKPKTRISITPSGRAALEDHWQKLLRVRERFAEGADGLEDTEAGDEA